MREKEAGQAGCGCLATAAGSVLGTGRVAGSFFRIPTARGWAEGLVGEREPRVLAGTFQAGFRGLEPDPIWRSPAPPPQTQRPIAAPCSAQSVQAPFCPCSHSGHRHLEREPSPLPSPSGPTSASSRRSAPVWSVEVVGYHGEAGSQMHTGR